MDDSPHGSPDHVRELAPGSSTREADDGADGHAADRSPGQPADQWRRVIDVLLAFCEFGVLVTRRLEAVAPDPELIRNSPLIILAVLEAEGPQRPTSLQQRTGLSSGGTTKALQRLEDLGLVVRESGADPHDGRVVRVSMTDRGREVLEDLGRAFGNLHEASRFARRAQEAVARLGQAIDDEAANQA